jgi:metacaspase-1
MSFRLLCCCTSEEQISPSPSSTNVAPIVECGKTDNEPNAEPESVVVPPIGIEMIDEVKASEEQISTPGAGKSDRPQATTNKVKPTFKAVLIGINYRGTSNELRGCIRDAKLVRDLLLETVPGAKLSQTRLLTDDEKVKPTRKNILSALEWLLAGAKEGTSMVLFYSGHGSYRKVESGEEGDDRDEAIVPLEGDFLYDDEIRVNLVNRVPKGAKLTVVFDCCNSGTTLDLRFNAKSPIVHKLFEDKSYRKTKGRVLYLGACTDKEESYESTAEIKIQGALTYQLVRFCEAQNTPFTCRELLDAISTWFITYTYPQHPQLSFGNDLDNLETPFSWTL